MDIIDYRNRPNRYHSPDDVVDRQACPLQLMTHPAPASTARITTAPADVVFAPAKKSHARMMHRAHALLRLQEAQDAVQAARSAHEAVCLQLGAVVDSEGNGTPLMPESFAGRPEPLMNIAARLRAECQKMAQDPHRSREYRTRYAVLCDVVDGCGGVKHLIADAAKKARALDAAVAHLAEAEDIWASIDA